MSDTVDPVFTAATAPGAPFEIAEVNGIKSFVNAPANMDLLIGTAKRYGDRTFIVEGDLRLSFTETFALRDALAAMLDITPGDRVAICMRNQSAWLIGYLAVIRAGGVAVLINSRGSPDELVAAIDSVSAKIALVDDHRAELIAQGNYQGRIIGASDFPPAGAKFAPPAPAQPDDPCTILFTSGTTGRVKGAVLTHRNIITGIMSMQLAGVMVLHITARRMGIEVEQLLANLPQQAVLLVFPLFHISGLGSAFLSPMLAGSKVVIMPKWDADEAAKLIETESINMFSAVPTMLWDLVHSNSAQKADLTSLTNIGSGGQALPINLLEAVREMCPSAVIGTGYGMTETSGSVAMAVGEDFVQNRASSGRVLSLIDLKIVSPDGTTLPPGEAGEIVVRGAQVMKEYWQLPEETAAVLSDDGWLSTGDVGYLDENNYIFIVDRVKDMVISGGENIYCAEVERALSEIPQITEFAAFGIPDDRLGELLVAVVRAKGIDADFVKSHVGERLARYKAPAHVVIIDEPLPRNDLGKANKAKLRKDWPDMAASLQDA